MKSDRPRTRFPLHGYAGAVIVLAAEAFLFAGNQLVGHWFTPIVWTGYILFIDALVHRFSDRSLLMTNRLEFVIIALISIIGWWLFEFYNAPRFWKSDLELWWHYHNLEPNLFLRRAGYDWAFATISPALFETAELLSLIFFKRPSRSISLNVSQPILITLILAGAGAAIIPLVYPSSWLAPIIWLAFILLLDPLNYFRRSPSIIGDICRGHWRRLWSLLLSGFVCGLLWEFWNYWAISKWTYTVPYFGSVKLFEMPILGFLGFPPFAVECWVMYIFARSVLSPTALEKDEQSFYVQS